MNISTHVFTSIIQRNDNDRPSLLSYHSRVDGSSKSYLYALRETLSDGTEVFLAFNVDSRPEGEIDEVLLSSLVDGSSDIAVVILDRNKESHPHEHNTSNFEFIKTITSQEAKEEWLTM